VRDKKNGVPRSGDSNWSRDVLPPLRGSDSSFALFPWADAHGYMLPSLRDSGNAQLQNWRFGLLSMAFTE
jgi:hypothetical protein